MGVSELNKLKVEGSKGSRSRRLSWMVKRTGSMS